MKILLIHQYFKEADVRGGARFNEMVRMWQEYGHDITVIAGNMDMQPTIKRDEYKGKFITKKDQNGVTVFRCYVSESYNTNFAGRLWGYFSFVISGSIAALFRAKGKFDIIIVTSPPLFVGVIASLSSFFKRVPFVFEVRDLWPESAIDTGVLKNKTIIRLAYWFESFIYKKARLINVLTPAFYKILLEKKSVPDNKLIEIPNAADFDLSDKLLDNFNRNLFRREHSFENKFVITYVGAHGVANGLNQVLDTAVLLKDQNVLFVFVGDGMQKKKLVERGKELGLTNVAFFDSVPKQEVMKFIIASDMGMSVLLKNDTFKTVYSNKTFDYMSCKKPIFMAIDGVSRDLVEKADAGIFVEPENPQDFADKILIYLNNPNLVKDQGENGYIFAKEHFDREVLAKKYLEEIKKIIKPNV